MNLQVGVRLKPAMQIAKPLSPYHNDVESGKQNATCVFDVRVCMCLSIMFARRPACMWQFLFAKFCGSGFWRAGAMNSARVLSSYLILLEIVVQTKTLNQLQERMCCTAVRPYTP